jgi:RimK family alpha-L-glutamate ligase
VDVHRVFLIGSAANETNVCLAEAWSRRGLEVELLSAAAACDVMRPLDIAIGRLDVLPTLDGVEPGMLELLRLEHQGSVVLNRAWALLACHDKLRTAHVLRAAGLPHPRTTVVKAGARVGIAPPVVVKPRFGSWGADVVRCETAEKLDACLATAAGKAWYRRHGALVQEYVPSDRLDLRILVAAGAVVGAVQREARRGEWRTNTALGGTRRRVSPSEEACELAVAAAAAVGTDLVGVDLLRRADDTYTVLELNGAVEFTSDYSLGRRDVYEETAEALGLVPRWTDGDDRPRPSIEESLAEEPSAADRSALVGQR